ncbi:MAG TPA: VOC family protein [Caulobacteraceae bacterium]|jgi:uncharacterized glyoxalase superfamily protein PhnB
MDGCRPLFNVADVGASLAFWRDALGFTEVARFDYEGRLAFARLMRGETEVMLNGRGGDPAPRRARPHYTEAVFYFRVDDVHALHRELLAKGLAPTEPERQDYGLDEIYLRDPDGYELAFTSPV